jgi:hypothetical protein
MKKQKDPRPGKLFSLKKLVHFISTRISVNHSVLENTNPLAYQVTSCLNIILWVTAAVSYWLSNLIGATDNILNPLLVLAKFGTS